MKILTLLMVGLFILTIGVGAENLGELEDIFKPEAMKIYKGKIYLVQKSKVIVYNLNGLKKVAEFGKKGSGPGESEPQPRLNFMNAIDVSDKGILIENIAKFLNYSKELKYINETRRSTENARLLGVRYAGDGYVGNKIMVKSPEESYASIVLVNDKFIPFKELHSQNYGQKGRVVKLASSVPNYVVTKNKIFIAKGEKGFLIDVYDMKGNELYSISKKEISIKIDSTFKERALKEFMEDPQIALQIKAAGGWDALKKLVSIEFPATCPFIKNIDSDGDEILIVRTYRVDKEGLDEFILMDLKGKEIKRVHLGIPDVGAVEKILGRGIKKYVFFGGKAYWLYDNEEDEVVELHCQKVY